MTRQDHLIHVGEGTGMQETGCFASFAYSGLMSYWVLWQEMQLTQKGGLFSLALDPMLCYPLSPALDIMLY